MAMGQSKLPAHFVAKEVTVADQVRRYAVHVPPAYERGKPWPLIIFLHGAGERGDDGIDQTTVGLARTLPLWRRPFPFIGLYPQCAKGRWWDQEGPLFWASLEKTLSEYTIDEDRIYLTGLSRGRRMCKNSTRSGRRS